MYTDELTDLLVKGLKAVAPAILSEFGDEDIYALSLETDESSFGGGFSFTLYVNTEENHARRVKEATESGDDDDPWYYRFCEYEWYIRSEPEQLNEANDFINNGYATFDAATIYECIVSAVEKLRAEKFFESVFPHNIFFSINATEEFDSDEMIDFVVRMNGRENCTDYIDNADSFL